MFDDLRHAGLKLYPTKCQFLQHEVQFLGHMVSAIGGGRGGGGEGG